MRYLELNRYARFNDLVAEKITLTSVQFLWFPCGVVRGALAALGINATVQAETTDLPQAIFQIKTVPTKS